jgi:hypothetical protein
MVKKIEPDTQNANENGQPVLLAGVTPPKIHVAQFLIEGTAPYVQLRFSQKAKSEMRARHMGGDTGLKKKERQPKDFAALYKGATYEAVDGWHGINAMSFKSSMLSACRLTKMKMVLAKIALFIEADGFDKDDTVPLVRIIKGEPRQVEHICRNANGMPDLRVRAMWDQGWQAKLSIIFDSEILALDDVANLLMRSGMQVGIGEGRPDSTRADGSGMGWGTFKIITE